MKIRITSLGLPAALLAASLFGACSNTAKGIQEDTAQNAAKAKDASAEAAAGAAQTVDIKTALIADKSVDASGINVDTNGTTKTVTLKGHVPNAAQKATAARIAKSKAPGYTVVNNLTIE